MELVGYLVLAGVIGFVGWRFLKRISRPAGTGDPIRPPRDGGSNKQR